MYSLGLDTSRGLHHDLTDHPERRTESYYARAWLKPLSDIVDASNTRTVAVGSLSQKRQVGWDSHVRISFSE
jgi:hypothetical protein